MQSLEDGKYFLMKNFFYSFKKKKQNVSTDLTTESASSEQMVTKKLQSVIEGWEGVWLA